MTWMSFSHNSFTDWVGDCVCITFLLCLLPYLSAWMIILDLTEVQ